MKAQALIDYCDRQIYVTYDWSKAEPDVNYGEQASLIKAEYFGKDITRLINQSKVEDAIVDHEIDYALNDTQRF